MPEENIILEIEKEAKKYFEEAFPCHDWSHVQRVYNNALQIASREGGNLFIIKLAVLLHDLGRQKESEDPENLDHAQISVEYASEILDKYGINSDAKKQILHCIYSHRFRKNREPKTLEAKIVFDADKLDVIGAIGIARAYVFAGEHNLSLYSDKNYLGTGYEKDHNPVTEFLFKLSKIKDRMLTETGRLLSQERHQYMAKFFERLKKEIQGEL